MTEWPFAREQSYLYAHPEPWRWGMERPRVPGAPAGWPPDRRDDGSPEWAAGEAARHAAGFGDPGHDGLWWARHYWRRALRGLPPQPGWEGFYEALADLTAPEQGPTEQTAGGGDGEPDRVSSSNPTQ